MAMTAAELQEWLENVVSKEGDDALIAIDEGGLALRQVNDPVVYIEIGGFPERENCLECPCRGLADCGYENCAAYSQSRGGRK